MKNLKTILLIVAGCVILFLLFCNKPKTIVIDNTVVPTKQLDKNLKADSTAIQNIIDSAATEYGYLEIKLNQSEAQRKKENSRAKNLEDQVDEILNAEPNPELKDK